MSAPTDEARFEGLLMRYCCLMSLAVVLAVLFAGQAFADPTLNRINLGSYATGPQITAADLRGRVVVVEYWGITCGPCLAAIPHTTELAKKYGHDKLLIIANQVWGASDKQCKDTWEARAKSNFVAVFNGGSVQGFQPAGVPSAVIFDHEGNFVWQGHPGAMDGPLAEVIAKVPAKAVREAAEQGPEPIVKDLETRYYEREVRQINEQTRAITPSISRLTRDAERGNEERVAEAKAILAQIDAWVQARSEALDAAKADDPVTAYGIAEQMAELLRGDDRAAVFAETIKAYEADEAAMTEIRATRMLREIKAQAQAIGLNDDVQKAKAENSNSRDLRQIERDLRRLIGAWPETTAGREAVELQKAWGFE